MKTPTFVPALLAGSLLAAFASLATLQAASFYVDTPAQFSSGVDKYGNNFAVLHSGDRVYLKGGSWSAMQGVFTGTMSDANAQSNPAIILACDSGYHPLPGGVTVNGLVQIQLAGAGIVFTGVTFSSQSGMLKEGTQTDYDDADGVAYMFWLKPASRYMTLSHLRFDRCGWDNTHADNDHYGPWVQVNGYRHTIQYCEMTGRDVEPDNDGNPVTYPAGNRSIRNATITFFRSPSGETSDFGQSVVRYCYFGERKVPVGADGPYEPLATGTDHEINDMGNGWETIRIGYSGDQDADLAVTVEKNVFYHAIYAVTGLSTDIPGDTEMISSKSRRSVIRSNTILNGYGQVTFRAGDYGLAQGNYFLGGAAYDGSGNIVFTESLNNSMGGVRAIGFGHTISNNYFYKLKGSTYNSALCITEGSTPTTSGANLNNGGGVSYETTNYAHVIGNTFYDCKTINLDFKKNGSYLPYGTRIINNLIHYSSSQSASGIVVSDTNYSLSAHGGTASGNWVYSPVSGQLGRAVSVLGSTGNTTGTSSAQNPKLTSLYSGVIYVPASDSPVLNGAVALPAVNDTSATGPSYSLAATVASAGALGLRGIDLGGADRDIGNFEVSVTSPGQPPLRRGEVGIVDGAYPGYPPELLKDEFADGERVTQFLPTSAAWYGNNSTALAVSGNAMTVTPTGHGVGYFTATTAPRTLAVGDSLRASFSLVFSGFSFTATSNYFRVALLNSFGSSSDHNAATGANRISADGYASSTAAFFNYGGYLMGVAMNPTSASAMRLYAHNFGGTSGIMNTASYTVLPSTGGTGAWGFVPGNTYTGSLIVQRTGTSAVSVTLAFTGTFANGSGTAWSHTLPHSSSTDATYTFDTLAFHLSSGGGVTSLALDNITVEHIPVP